MNVDRYLRMIAGAFVLLSLALGLLGEPVLVSVHRVRRTQPVSIGLYELVSDDDHPSEVGSAQHMRMSCLTVMRDGIRAGARRHYLHSSKMAVALTA